MEDMKTQYHLPTETTATTAPAVLPSEQEEFNTYHQRLQFRRQQQQQKQQQQPISPGEQEEFNTYYQRLQFRRQQQQMLIALLHVTFQNDDINSINM